MSGKHLASVVALLSGMCTVASATQPNAPEWHDVGTFGAFELRRPPPCLLQRKEPPATACKLPTSSGTASGLSEAEALRQKIVMRVWLQQFIEARKELDTAIESNPKNAAAWHLRARLNFHDSVYNGAQQLKSALHDAEQAGALAPHNPNISLTRSSALFRTGKADSALALATEVTERVKDNAQAWMWRGMLENAQNQRRRAIQSYEKAVALDATLIEAKRPLALLQLFSGNPKRAVALFDEVIKADPFQRDDYLWRSKANRSLGHLQASADDLTTLIEGPRPGAKFLLTNNDRGQVLMERAMIRAALGQTDTAADDMVKAAEAGGKQHVLRIQLLLKREGMAVNIDGKPSDELKRAIRTCIADAGCRNRLSPGQGSSPPRPDRRASADGRSARDSRNEKGAAPVKDRRLAI